MSATTKTKTKFRTTSNPEFSRAMHAKRSSNCTQPYDSRPNRQRSRQDAKRAAVKSGW